MLLIVQGALEFEVGAAAAVENRDDARQHLARLNLVADFGETSAEVFGPARLRCYRPKAYRRQALGTRAKVHSRQEALPHDAL